MSAEPSFMADVASIPAPLLGRGGGDCGGWGSTKGTCPETWGQLCPYPATSLFLPHFWVPPALGAQSPDCSVGRDRQRACWNCCAPSKEPCGMSLRVASNG